MAIKVRPLMFLQRQEDSVDSGLASKIRKHREKRVHAHRSTIGHCTHENRWGFAHAQASTAPGHRLWHHEHLQPVRVYFHVSGYLGASVLTSSCDGAQIKPGSTSCPEFDEEPPSAMGKRKYDEYGDYAGNEDGSIWITATGIAKVTVFPRYFPRW